MKPMILGVSLTFLALALSANLLRAAQGDDKGWVQLFNGKDKEGWKVHPDEPGDWTVKDGILIGKGAKRSHIYTNRGDYENFHFRIEAKINDKGNSGQYFRTAFPEKANYPKGYEAQINSTHPDPQKTGSLYNFAKITDMLVPPDTWFTQEVIAKGNHIIILVDGKKVVDFVDKNNTYTKGHFAIQQHPPAKGSAESIIMIKKAEVKELPAEPKKGAKNEGTRLKEEQIQVLEKMAEQYEQVTDKATFEIARVAMGELENALQQVNQKFIALPKDQRDLATMILGDKEDDAVSRLREAKTRANQAAGAIKKAEVKELPPEPKKGANDEGTRLKEEQIRILEKMIEVFEKVTDKNRRATLDAVRPELRELEKAYQEANEQFNALPEDRRDAVHEVFKERESEVVERFRDAKQKAHKAAASAR